MSGELTRRVSMGVNSVKMVKAMYVPFTTVNEY